MIILPEVFPAAKTAANLLFGTVFGKALLTAHRAFAPAGIPEPADAVPA